MHSNKLIIEVINAEIIIFEKLKPDPYVLLLFKGIKKKTTFKKSELNPMWNEVNNIVFKVIFFFNLI